MSETYSWNQRVYDELLTCKEKGTYMAVDVFNIGTVISVEKKIDSEDLPYIEVIYQISA